MFAKTHRGIWILIAALIPSACMPIHETAVNPPINTAETPASAEPPSATQAVAELSPVVVGYNPLTGLPVPDPSLLALPASLVSISHFPVTARPQAGLSVAPYVFEIYITEGATRFLTTLYGEFPAPEVPIKGNCEVRTEIFAQTNLLLGNQVWNDANQNGINDAWEKGIGGICVNLYD